LNELSSLSTLSKMSVMICAPIDQQKILPGWFQNILHDVVHRGYLPTRSTKIRESCKKERKDTMRGGDSTYTRVRCRRSKRKTGSNKIDGMDRHI